MKNERSPGIDGLPCEFYRFCWEIIGDKFVEMVNVCFQNGQLSPTQKIGVITLLCKDRQNSHLLKNWRPISLLCVDYKIISKCITNRIRKVMGNLIHIDQTASVPGRSIQDNIHLLRNLIDYCNQKQMNCVILSLDQMKAFDRVSHDFMFQVLEKYGFGPMLLKWVKLLYTDIYSTVLVNGYFTDIFGVFRSVRQGCSLSPLLYVLCIEPFAVKIRSDPHIKGVKLPGSKEFSTISQYADDTTLTVLDRFSVQKILLISELYGLASGAKLNKDKCWSILIGNWGDQNNIMYGIKCTDGSRKICGVMLGNGNISAETWDLVFQKFQNSIALNSKRNLKLRGKSVLLNSLALSKIWYVVGVFDMDQRTLERIQKVVFNFIWSNKTECIKREVLYNTCQDGGIGLTNVLVKQQAFLIKHVCSLLYGPYRKWHDFALYWLKLDLRKYLKPDMLINRPYSLSKPSFYVQVLDAFKIFIAIEPDFDPLTISVKKVYFRLLEPKLKLPRVFSVFPNIKYAVAFSNCNSGLLSPEARDVTFRIIHQVIPVNLYLYSLRRIVKSPKCIFCKNLDESIAHLFYNCTTVIPLWKYIKSLVNKIPNINILIDEHFVVYNIFKKSPIFAVNSLFLILVSEARWAIWYCRNLHKFQEKNVNSDFIKYVFLSNLRLRLKADFYRLGTKFERLWCHKNIFCKLVNDKPEILF